MRLDVQSIGEIQALLQSEDLAQIASVNCTEITLAAAIDLSRAILSAEKRKSDSDAQILRNLFPSVEFLEECNRAWLHQGPLSLGSDIHGTRHHEFFPLSTYDGLSQAAWHPFEARFARSLKATGFPSLLADGMVDVLNEMADNVIQHSTSNPRMPARSVIGYCVDNGEMNFVISDAGQGALASLQVNPTWTALKSDREALCAIVEKHATRKAENTFGDGYRTMFRMLSDHNALVRLRSRDGFYELKPSSTSRVSHSGDAPCIAGFQITVSCAVKNEPKEIKLC